MVRTLEDRAARNRRRHTWGYVSVLLLLACWWVTLGPVQVGGPAYYAVVRGHSMEPFLEPGDLVVSRKLSNYEIGQVILYRQYGGALIHRIVAKQADGRFVTQGINNLYRDSWRVSPRAILGALWVKLPGWGAALNFASEYPISGGLLAAGITGMSLVSVRRPKYTNQLKVLLTQATSESKRLAKRARVGVDVFVFVLLLTLVTLVMVLLKQVPFWPDLALVLLAVLAASIGALLYAEFAFAGIGLAEPNKSIVVLSSHLYRLPIEVEIAGPVRRVESALQLAELAETAKLPVLHQVDPNGPKHRFTLVTATGNYVWDWHQNA